MSYMRNLKRHDTNDLIYKTERLTDLENKLLLLGVRIGGKDIRSSEWTGAPYYI